MKLIRYQSYPQYNPVHSFTTLRDEMDRLFDVALPAFSSLQRDWQGEFPVDLYQDRDAFVVRAELPGFRKEDLGVEVADGILTVTGHQKAESGEKEKSTIQERRVSRAISLPDRVNAEKIQAAYENGILTVTLPKLEEVKPRQITVEVK